MSLRVSCRRDLFFVMFQHSDIKAPECLSINF